MKIVTPTNLLSALSPYKRLLGCVKHDGVFGLSISDPYLSYAKPIHVKDLDKDDIGGMVFGFQDNLDLARQSIIKDCELVSIYDRNISEDELWAKFESEILWEDVGLTPDMKQNSIPMHVRSAIMLQSFLDEFSEGWANTFG